MTLNIPPLDIRDFETLKNEALEIIKRKCPQWSDLSSSDPGIVLLESFAYLTDVMLYKLNQIPRNVYIEVLQLFGIQSVPSFAAGVYLSFSVVNPSENPIIIPKNCCVGLEESDDICFLTSDMTEIKPGECSVDVIAHNCKFIDGEVIGISNGESGNVYKLKSGEPIKGALANLKVEIGVELEEDEVHEKTIIISGKRFGLWNEVHDISFSTVNRQDYMINYSNGEIAFPSIDNKKSVKPIGIPKKDREIRAWYYIGGGEKGNIAPFKITKLLSEFKDSDLLKVENKSSAIGGCDQEELDVTLLRAPKEVNSQKRAVTARDYETLTCNISGVERAKAITQKSLYSYGKPGTVCVYITPDDSIKNIESKEAEALRRNVENDLNSRSVLGTSCIVEWASIKNVGVKAEIITLPGFPFDVVIENVKDAINKIITPGYKGFGENIQLAEIYKVVLNSPGVAFINNMGFIVEGTPDNNVIDINADYYIDGMWYALEDDRLFTSINNGESWEVIGKIKDYSLNKLVTDANNPGYIAFIGSSNNAENIYKVFVSNDCGKNLKEYSFNFKVSDLSWVTECNCTNLYISSYNGVFKLNIEKGLIEEVLISKNASSGFYEIHTYPEKGETEYIVLISRLSNGVYVSNCDDNFKSFKEVGFVGKDIRTLTIEECDSRAFLWFGQSAVAETEGTGCFKIELSRVMSAKQIYRFDRGWIGGSCRSLSIYDGFIWAATHRSGLLRLDLNNLDNSWEHSLIDSNLPKRDTERIFTPINSINSNKNNSVLMVATENGLYRSNNNSFYRCSEKVKYKHVSAPINYIFKTSNHDIRICESHD